MKIHRLNRFTKMNNHQTSSDYPFKNEIFIFSCSFSSHAAISTVHVDIRMKFGWAFSKWSDLLWFQKEANFQSWKCKRKTQHISNYSTDIHYNSAFSVLLAHSNFVNKLLTNVTWSDMKSSGYGNQTNMVSYIPFHFPNEIWFSN